MHISKTEISLAQEWDDGEKGDPETDLCSVQRPVPMNNI